SSSTTTSMARAKGTALAAMDSTGCPVMPDITNRFSPSGGVMKPMPSAVTMKMQNWMSFMPIDWASGNMIGDRITILGVVSITQPAMMKMPSIIRMMSAGSVVSALTEATMLCGTWLIASTCASGSATAMMGTMTPHTLADPSRDPGKSLSRNVPWNTPTTMVVTTATAAASVGVNTPE